MAKNNPVLGYRECPECSTRGTVHKIEGTRKQLYQRCDCGCLQGNGPFVQSRLWYETQWLEGLRPDMPLMVLDRPEYEKQLARVTAVNLSRCPSRDLEESGIEDESAQIDDIPIEQAKGKKGGGILILAAVTAGVLAAMAGG